MLRASRRVTPVYEPISIPVIHAVRNNPQPEKLLNSIMSTAFQPMTSPPPTFREARDLLLELHDNYCDAKTAFVWPRPERFNWALDWFDAELAAGEAGASPALKVLGKTVETKSFAELSEASSRLASGLRALGAKRGDRLLMMLGTTPELWVTMLASMKLGLVLIPAMPTLGPDDIADRLERGRAKFIVAHAEDVAKFAGLGADVERIAVGETPEGWRAFKAVMNAAARFQPDGPTLADDPMLLYFTSGTTARPKLVLHTHASYPIGHLSTMYGLGLRPGDAHLNISSPGWAKHAWSSVFAPWNAGAAVLALAKRFEPRQALDILVAHEVTSFCAPPTVWRMLIQEDLAQWKVKLREVEFGRRAAQSGGDRPGPARLGPDDPRFLRPDRDDDDDRQRARAEGRRRLDGAAAAGLSRRPARRRGARSGRGRDRDSAAAAPRRPDARLSERRRRDCAARGRLLPHRRRRRARRRRLHHLCRPRRRRVQIERLPAQPVRTRERADRARGGGGGGGGAGAGSAAATRGQGLYRACRRVRARPRHGARDLRAF